MTRTYDEESNTVYVRKNRCDTCVFGRNRPVSQARVNGMVRDADRDNSCIPCHKHLYEGAPIEPVCRGYYDRKSSMTLRLADMLGIIKFTNDKGEVI